MKSLAILKRVGLLLLVSLLALNIAAQSPGGPGRGIQMTEEDIKEQVDNMAKTLDLSDEQHKKVLAIDMDFYNKMQIERQKMMNAGGPPSEAERSVMREKMMKMRDDRNTQYEAVLTADQYKKFLELQEQRRNEMRQQREQNPPEGDDQDRPARGRG